MSSCGPPATAQLAGAAVRRVHDLDRRRRRPAAAARAAAARATAARRTVGHRRRRRRRTAAAAPAVEQQRRRDRSQYARSGRGEQPAPARADRHVARVVVVVRQRTRAQIARTSSGGGSAAAAGRNRSRASVLVARRPERGVSSLFGFAGGVSRRGDSRVDDGRRASAARLYRATRYPACPAPATAMTARRLADPVLVLLLILVDRLDPRHQAARFFGLTDSRCEHPRVKVIRAERAHERQQRLISSSPYPAELVRASTRPSAIASSPHSRLNKAERRSSSRTCARSRRGCSSSATTTAASGARGRRGGRLERDRAWSKAPRRWASRGT